jgi:hypothetical protein
MATATHPGNLRELGRGTKLSLYGMMVVSGQERSSGMFNEAPTRLRSDAAQRGISYFIASLSSVFCSISLSKPSHSQRDVQPMCD